ncbi:MAG: DUF373 family protein [Candidatus Methanomethyliales bacterium]|nr:DUF373 family protein [Candidatus Methanomethylicales archaeon]
MSQKIKRILVLSVDKDNDIGRVTGVSTPIIGRDKILSVATLFALKNPEDSDANSVFAAINTYDSLVDQGFVCEVAVLTGTPEGGFKSDLKISSELEYVLNNFRADGAIFVSDGTSDEQVIPVIQAKIPIISVKRVFVQQEKSVEATYVLFYRYLKKLGDPEFSKFALGVPGILLLAVTILYLLDLISYAIISLGIIVGIVLILKGFYIDKLIKSAWAESPIRLITSLISIIISVVSIYRGISIAFLEASPFTNPPLFASSALTNTIDLLAIGVAVYIVGRLVVKYLDSSPKIWHEIVGIVALIFIRQIVLEASSIIRDPRTSLIPFLLISGLGVLVCGFLVVIFSLRPIFKKRSLKEVKKSD